MKDVYRILYSVLNDSTIRSDLQVIGLINKKPLFNRLEDYPFFTSQEIGSNPYEMIIFDFGQRNRCVVEDKAHFLLNAVVDSIYRDNPLYKKDIQPLVALLTNKEQHERVSTPYKRKLNFARVKLTDKKSIIYLPQREFIEDRIISPSVQVTNKMPLVESRIEESLNGPSLERKIFIPSSVLLSGALGYLNI